MIQQYYTITHIYAHEETGNNITYARDLTIINYCATYTINLKQYPSNGVVRKLANRDGRHKIRESRMTQTIIPQPQPLPSLHTIHSQIINQILHNMQSFVVVAKPQHRNNNWHLPGPTAAKQRLITFLK